MLPYHQFENRYLPILKCVYYKSLCYKKSPPALGRLLKALYLKYKNNHPIHHAGRYAKHQHRPGHGEKLRPQACNEALCLCQVRTNKMGILYNSSIDFMHPFVLFEALCFQTVKITFIQPILHDAILLEFAFRMVLRYLHVDFSRVLQNIPVIRQEESVYSSGPSFRATWREPSA